LRADPLITEVYGILITKVHLERRGRGWWLRRRMNETSCLMLGVLYKKQNTSTKKGCNNNILDGKYKI
jgi:hypothetical protein